MLAVAAVAVPVQPQILPRQEAPLPQGCSCLQAAEAAAVDAVPTCCLALHHHALAALVLAAVTAPRPAFCCGSEDAESASASAAVAIILIIIL